MKGNAKRSDGFLHSIKLAARDGGKYSSLPSSSSSSSSSFFTVCYCSCWMINPFIIHHAIAGEGGGVADRIIDGPIYITLKANDSV